MTAVLADEVIACLRQLPALPSAVAQLLTTFGNEEVDVAEIARQIGRDQALAARLLRVANSSFYGLQGKVATINDAVVILGFSAVRSMVLAVGISGVFRADHCPGFDRPAYVRHAVGVGLAARALARQTGRNAELAFTGGILHDIGALVLASCFPDSYSEAMAYRERHECSHLVAERDIIGLDHAEIGGLLADAWSFPASLRAALAGHHAPAEFTADLPADLIHVADGIAHALGLSQSIDEMVLPVDRTAWHRLGMDQQKIAAILPQVAGGMDEACLIFNA